MEEQNEDICELKQELTAMEAFCRENEAILSAELTTTLQQRELKDVKQKLTKANEELITQAAGFEEESK